MSRFPKTWHIWDWAFSFSSLPELINFPHDYHSCSATLHPFLYSLLFLWAPFFFFLLSPPDHGDFVGGNVTSLHASSQTTLHFPGGAWAFHVRFPSALGSMDNYIWHSSLILPKLGLKWRLSCINVVVSVPSHWVLLWIALHLCSVSVPEQACGEGERLFWGLRRVCLCCMLSNAWDSKDCGWWRGQWKL